MTIVYRLLKEAMSHPGGAECIQVSWLVDIVNGQNYDPSAEAAIATQDDIDITLDFNIAINNISTGLLSQGADYSQASSFGSSQLLDSTQLQYLPHLPQPLDPQHKGHNSDPLLPLQSSTAVAKGGVKRSRPIFGLQDALHERKEGEKEVAVSIPTEDNANQTINAKTSIPSKKLKSSQPPQNEFKNKSNSKENLTTTTTIPATTLASPTPSSSSTNTITHLTITRLTTSHSTNSGGNSSSILKHSFPTLTTAITTATRSGMRGTNKTSSASSNSSSATKKAKI